MIGVTIIGIVLSLFVAHCISKPIKKLTNVVDEISKGNFKVKIKKLSNIDEIKRLTEAMDRALASIKLTIMKKKGAKGEEDTI